MEIQDEKFEKEDQDLEKKSEKEEEIDVDTSNWPLLLRNYGKLKIRTKRFTSLPYGYSPLKRPIKEYLKYGIINLDKPANPSSHEVVSWVKKILEVEKTGHSGTLDPKVTGSLVICIEKATRLVKSQQNAGKEYIAICKLHAPFHDVKKIQEVIQSLTGSLFQTPPAISAVKKVLRIRTIYKSEFIEYLEDAGLILFRVECEAGTYIRCLCEHIGLLLGTGGHMEELRRTRTGHITIEKYLRTMHDVLDSFYLLKNKGQEDYIRRVVLPLEVLLTSLKRIVIKDSSVAAICHGGQIMLPGVIRYEEGIEIAEEVVLITTKGEAVALAYAVMTSEQIALGDHGVVAKTKRVIMDRDLYKKNWGHGPVSTLKKKLISAGKLDKYGLPTTETPKEWMDNYVDVGGNKWYYVQKAKIEAGLPKIEDKKVDDKKRKRDEKIVKKEEKIEKKVKKEEKVVKKIEKEEIKDEEIEAEIEAEIEEVEEKIEDEEKEEVQENQEVENED